METRQDFIQQIREFNRFYTAQIGILNRNYLDTGYSVTENRIFYELYSRQEVSANQLSDMLQLDKGYISRILSNFEKNGLITRLPAGSDRRKFHIHLTQKGQAEARRLIGVTNQMLSQMLAPLDDETCQGLCQAMDYITKTLKPEEIEI